MVSVPGRGVVLRIQHGKASPLCVCRETTGRCGIEAAHMVYRAHMVYILDHSPIKQRSLNASSNVGHGCIICMAGMEGTQEDGWHEVGGRWG